jgi:hypothetical protein
MYSTHATRYNSEYSLNSVPEGRAGIDLTSVQNFISCYPRGSGMQSFWKFREGVGAPNQKVFLKKYNQATD